jgi:hypothetical protein
LKPVQSLSGIFLDADLERLLKIQLPLIKKNDDEYGEIALMGDFHLGHESLSKTVLSAYINYIKTHPHIQIGFMGDIIEYGEGSTYISDEEVPKVDDQIQIFKGLFKPLANRIKFMLWGNHEERFVKQSKSKRLMLDLALELGLDPDKDVYVGKPQRGIYVTFIAGDKNYGAYFAHSKTRAAVNQEIQLQRSGFQNLVAINGFGHTHKLGWRPRTFRTLELIDGNIYNVVRRQYLVSTGCFLKYPSYAEAASMPYTDVGCPFIKLYSTQHQVQFYDLTGVYKEYLGRSGIALPKLKLDKSFDIKLGETEIRNRGLLSNEAKKLNRLR